VVIRCTEKLLALIGQSSRRSLAAIEPDDDDWYANLVWLDRRKCVLFTHAGTLFSALAANVGVADIRSIQRLAVTLIEGELLAERLPADTFGDLHSSPITLARTASRSVLGCMNDMVALCEAAVDDAGGLHACDVGALNRQLQRTIFRAREYVPVLELAAGWRESSADK
jgi:hypothetical protein